MKKILMNTTIFFIFCCKFDIAKADTLKVCDVGNSTNPTYFLIFAANNNNSSNRDTLINYFPYNYNKNNYNITPMRNKCKEITLVSDWESKLESSKGIYIRFSYATFSEWTDVGFIPLTVAAVKNRSCWISTDFTDNGFSQRLEAKMTCNNDSAIM